MDWTGVGTITSLITGLTGAGLGVGSLIRTSREVGAKERADAASVGLEYMREAMKTQQATILNQQNVITKQEGEIGELKGQLRECKEERQIMGTQLSEQAVQIKALQDKMG